jgi:hypothetical protein
LHIFYHEKRLSQEVQSALNAARPMTATEITAAATSTDPLSRNTSLTRQASGGGGGYMTQDDSTVPNLSRVRVIEPLLLSTNIVNVGKEEEDGEEIRVSLQQAGQVVVDGDKGNDVTTGMMEIEQEEEEELFASDAHDRNEGEDGGNVEAHDDRNLDDDFDQFDYNQGEQDNVEEQFVASTTTANNNNNNNNNADEPSKSKELGTSINEQQQGTDSSSSLTTNLHQTTKLKHDMFAPVAHKITSTTTAKTATPTTTSSSSSYIGNNLNHSEDYSSSSQELMLTLSGPTRAPSPPLPPIEGKDSSEEPSQESDLSHHGSHHVGGGGGGGSDVKNHRVVHASSNTMNVRETNQLGSVSPTSDKSPLQPFKSSQVSPPLSSSSSSSSSASSISLSSPSFSSPLFSPPSQTHALEQQPEPDHELEQQQQQQQQQRASSSSPSSYQHQGRDCQMDSGSSVGKDKKLKKNKRLRRSSMSSHYLHCCGEEGGGGGGGKNQSDHEGGFDDEDDFFGDDSDSESSFELVWGATKLGGDVSGKRQSVCER